MIRWTIYALIMASVAAMGVVAYRSLTSPQAVRAIEVQRGEIEQYVEERAKSRLPRTHVVATPFAGRIRPVELIVGQRVEKGAVIAEMVRADLDQQIAAAQAVVAQREAMLVENADDSLETTLAAQTERMIEAAANLVASTLNQSSALNEARRYAEIWLGRQKKLASSDAGSREELEKAELALILSQSRLERGQLDVKMQQALQQAIRLTPQAIKDYLSRKRLQRSVVKAELAEAQARLDELKTRVARAVMRSPTEGVVLARKDASEQFLPAGSEVARIGQLQLLEIEADILTEDALLVRQGQPARIYRDASREGEAWEGEVHAIHPEGFTKISSLGVEQQRVKVILRFRGDSLATLGVGYRLQVRIITDRRADAIIIPRTALFRDAKGRWSVFSIEEDRAISRNVEIGLANDRLVEITKGLDVGNRVVIAPENSLRNGDRVKADER